jgi:hypothetical protein
MARRQSLCILRHRFIVFLVFGPLRISLALHSSIPAYQPSESPIV